MFSATSSCSSYTNHFQLQDENGNDIQPEEASASQLREQLEKLHNEFIAAGNTVSKAVNERADMYNELDRKKEELTLRYVEEQESGIDDIDEDDPLRFIESDYPFFREANQCSLDDVSNVEHPKKCIQAIESFLKVLYNNVHRFKHLPKGPLYKEIKVKNKRWAPLAEYVLRPYLFTFLVDNIVDGLVMQELIEKHFPSVESGAINKQGVVCPKYFQFAFHNQFQIESRVTSIKGLQLENCIESIHYDDEDWGKFLSSEMSIEKIIFMENENAAFLVMSHVKSTPWHVHMAYTLDGFCVHPFPNFRTKKIRFHSRPMHLKCIPDFEIMALLMKIKKIEAKIETINNSIDDKRKVQLDLAVQLDAIKLVYSKKAAEKQKRLKPKKKKKKVKEESTYDKIVKFLAK